MSLDQIINVCYQVALFLSHSHSKYTGIVQKRNMFIQTEPTPNPDSLKFLPEEAILKPGQFAEFKTAMEAVRSPLAKMLFRIDVCMICRYYNNLRNLNQGGKNGISWI